MHLAARWVLYPLLVHQVALSPRQWASALNSVCWGIFVGRFHQHGGFILGTGLLPWVYGQFCGSSGSFVVFFMDGRNPRDAFARGG